MTAIAISETLLAALRQRRCAGESVKAMAAEVGVTWQKLDKALRNGLRCKADRIPPPQREQARKAVTAVLGQAQGTGPLAERYRPRGLANLFGQAKVVEFLRRFAASPYSSAYLFSGDTGTGKTSAALALAAELGCAVDQGEFGGVHVIASGEQSAEAVREICQRMWQAPMCGSGWKVVIVNEADRMHPAAETIWLDRLENLPTRTVIVFTTNHPDKLSQRFRDRCVELGFVSDADGLARDARRLLASIWQAETSQTAEPSSFSHLVDQSTINGQLSFRRAIQALTVALAERKE